MTGTGATDPADPDLRAAEYVLGTLNAEERAAVEREAAGDPAAQARISAWERRLSSLMAAVPAEKPPAHVRTALLQSLPGSPGQIARLHRQVRSWQIAAVSSGLLAAGLALFVAVRSQPEQEGGRYLAVVQSGGALPALIVRVDTRTGTAQVRPVGATAPAGRSLELWYVGDQGPKSLGLVGTAPSEVSLPSGSAPGGVIAVSVEPPGGSPTGQATGPVVYTGKLISE